MLNLDMKKMNIFTILSGLLFLAGIGFYIWWGLRFGVWADIGIYSVAIVFILGGIIGMLLSLYEQPSKQ
ncbi:MAG TPA: hypothetical protein VKP59_02685 [Candidatus Thermoplasmatota archaeon]|nr:hypothetical protein [Candidatus Thermoplasmatota archaeon]